MYLTRLKHFKISIPAFKKNASVVVVEFRCHCHVLSDDFHKLTEYSCLDQSIGVLPMFPSRCVRSFIFLEAPKKNPIKWATALVDKEEQ